MRNEIPVQLGIARMRVVVPDDLYAGILEARDIEIGLG